jgi:predicted ferric reductase
MTTKSSAPNTVEIGKYGVLPDPLPAGELESTVLSVGGVKGEGALVAVLHALTWVIALIFILAWGNNELGKVSGVTDAAKTLGNVYGWFIIAIVVVVLLHSMLAKKEEPFSSTLASVVLFTLVLFEFSLGCAYLSYSLSSDSFYTAAVMCHLVVCAGCAMILTFYVNFTHNGNLTARAFGPK